VSASLHWKPVPKPEEDNQLSSDLMHVLGRTAFNDSYRDYFSCHPQFDKDNLSYLFGLRDAGVDGAQELIDLIWKHGTVELYLEF